MMVRETMWILSKLLAISMDVKILMVVILIGMEIMILL